MTKSVTDVDVLITAPKFALNLNSGTIRLASIEANRYLNLIVSKDVSTISPETAQRLRDELNRVYPVEAVEAPKVTKRAAPKGAQAYKGNGKHDWEKVENSETTTTLRLRVPGGWLYRTTTIVERLEYVATNTEFVPVPEVVGYAV